MIDSSAILAIIRLDGTSTAPVHRGILGFVLSEGKLGHPNWIVSRTQRGAAPEVSAFVGGAGASWAGEAPTWELKPETMLGFSDFGRLQKEFDLPPGKPWELSLHMFLSAYGAGTANKSVVLRGPGLQLIDFTEGQAVHVLTLSDSSSDAAVRATAAAPVLPPFETYHGAEVRMGGSVNLTTKHGFVGVVWPFASSRGAGSYRAGNEGGERSFERAGDLVPPALFASPARSWWFEAETHAAVGYAPGFVVAGADMPFPGEEIFIDSP